jgi:glycerol kinase
VNVLAIDQGTSATKALLAGPGGQLLGRAEVPVSTRTVGADGVEADPEELLESVVAAGRRALAAAGGAPARAVALANQGETVLAWDRRTGRPLSPAIVWQDRRATGVCARLADRSAELAAITGLPLDPYFAAPKMTWLRRRDGEDGVITTVDAWLTHRLTGAFVTDAATASRTMLLDLATAGWSDEACSVFGLDRAAQPDVVDCDATVGETGAFGPPVPVSGLAVDQQAALFAQSCFAPGEAKCTYGTGAFVLANAGAAPPRSAAGLAACVAWRLSGDTSYCLDGQVYTAGAAVSWLERLGIIESAAQIDALCAGGSPAADAPLFVPALAGLGAPFWAPDARAAWSGMSLASDRADLVRAVIWGIAAQIATLAAAVADDLGRPLERLRVDGGLARSVTLLQAQADLLQVPVERYPSADATALGLAALARLGAGGAAGPAEAVGDWVPAAVFEPIMGRDEARERLERFRAAAEGCTAFATAGA